MSSIQFSGSEQIGVSSRIALPTPKRLNVFSNLISSNAGLVIPIKELKDRVHPISPSPCLEPVPEKDSLSKNLAYKNFFNRKDEFSDFDLIQLCQKTPNIDSLIKEISAIGFKYCGDTNSNSKAYTDVDRREIFIKKDKTPKEAFLSLVYEMTNAKNATRLKKIHSEFLHDPFPNDKQALQYAHAILRIEAEAVYNRSLAAMQVDLTHLIKNQKYVEIEKTIKKPEEAISQIHLEMIKNGTVHNGKKRAVEHYVSQYFEHNKKEKS